MAACPFKLLLTKYNPARRFEGIPHSGESRQSENQKWRLRRLDIICLPGTRRRNRLCRMAESTQAPTTSPARLSNAKVITIKIIALTVISLALIFGQSWAAPRYYQPDYIAGFYTGLLEGALMPAALPGLMAGKDVPIYAPNNEGRGYKIGFILGLNGCGTLFFGVAFWQPRRKLPNGLLD